MRTTSVRKLLPEAWGMVKSQVVTVCTLLLVSLYSIALHTYASKKFMTSAYNIYVHVCIYNVVCYYCCCCSCYIRRILVSSTYTRWNTMWSIESSSICMPGLNTHKHILLETCMYVCMYVCACVHACHFFISLSGSNYLFIHCPSTTSPGITWNDTTWSTYHSQQNC